jgi:hypothetical protein
MRTRTRQRLRSFISGAFGRSGSRRGENVRACAATPSLSHFLQTRRQSRVRTRGPGSFLYDECTSKTGFSPDCWDSSQVRDRGVGSVRLAHTVITFAAKEAGQFAALPELESTDRSIAACYERIRSFEQAPKGERESETPVGTLRDLADRAFTLGWNTKDLTHFQQAQILDILLSVADLMARIPCEET